MAKKHVEILERAIEIPEHYSKYMCDRIGYVTGIYKDFPEFIDNRYSQQDGSDLTDLISKNIAFEFSFDESMYAKQGMTREEWVKTILIPLAEKL